ncbi:hypothetical protein [Amycolatopsis sp. PS_44_ISF1]|uniref:hypothetical protein n=1 Tax=Amycolatopsis sp. PS_44_ISF1 TaxID=2974917 RepID=UPI0028DD986D|nr:hypothetical protein [Amycolatopsis sp. PS_44_ISF1]MDT8915074.1 hypothetical protein [Amycolatopsis sp. PS_44_ISF1]
MVRERPPCSRTTGLVFFPGTRSFPGLTAPLIISSTGDGHRRDLAHGRLTRVDVLV